MNAKEIHEGRKKATQFRINFNKQISDSKTLEMCSMDKINKICNCDIFLKF